MKPVLILLLMLMYQTGICQAGQFIGLGTQIVKQASEANNRNKVKKYLQYDTLNNIVVSKSRIPHSKIKGNIQQSIISIQQKLERVFVGVKKDSLIDFKEIEYDVSRIKNIDSDWDISFYLEEIRQYKEIILIRQEKMAMLRKQFELRERQQKRYNDSIDNIKNIAYLAVKKQKDSIEQIERQKYLSKMDSINSWAYNIRLQVLAQEKAKQDSLYIYERTKSYHFVALDDLVLYEKPGGNRIGKLSIGSYILVEIGLKDVKGYVKVSACDYDGYVLRKHIVNSIFLLPANIFNDVKNYYHCAISDIERVNTYIPYRISSGLTYYRGPKGGCYYINANGKKQYVDRSFCN